MEAANLKDINLQCELVDSGPEDFYFQFRVPEESPKDKAECTVSDLHLLYCRFGARKALLEFRDNSLRTRRGLPLREVN